MFSDVHISHLRRMQDAAEQAALGWRGLLDHAVSRYPDSVVAELRRRAADSESESEGWRALLHFADAHPAHPREYESALLAPHSSEPGGLLTPSQEGALARFQGAHDELASEDGERRPPAPGDTWVSGPSRREPYVKDGGAS